MFENARYFLLIQPFFVTSPAVIDHVQSYGDLRDNRAVQRLACGYLKLLFPNLEFVTIEEFDEFCLQPAIDLRSNIRRQMAIMDPEFSPKIADIRVC